MWNRSPTANLDPFWTTSTASYPGIWVIFDEYETLFPEPPKWWRWFDRFRRWSRVVERFSALSPENKVPRRLLLFTSLAERRAQKRRARICAL